MIIGKFIKAKAVKKTDDEVLEGFGAEKQSSDDDSLGQSMRQDGKNKRFYQKIFKKEILLCLNLIYKYVKLVPILVLLILNVYLKLMIFLASSILSLVLGYIYL